MLAEFTERKFFLILTLKIIINLESHWKKLTCKTAEVFKKQKPKPWMPKHGGKILPEFRWLTCLLHPSMPNQGSSSCHDIFNTLPWSSLRHITCFLARVNNWPTNAGTFAELASFRLCLYSSMSQSPRTFTLSLFSSGLFQVHLFQTFFCGLGTSYSAQVCDGIPYNND